MHILKLKKGKESSLSRFHPWIFSGAIQNISSNLAEGELVKVISNNNDFCGIGHFQPSSLAVRILSFKEEEINAHFWERKILLAYKTRQNLNFDAKTNEIYRLVHGEGDGLPGLIIDIFNQVAVIQCHSLGMFNSIHQIADALDVVFKNNLHTIFCKSSDTLPFKANQQNANFFLKGNANNIWACENNLLFFIDFIDGQKTGFFIDQRENRKLLASMCNNKSVLNTFCYSGGFSVYALKGGAKKVVSIDSSEKAMQLVQQNVAKNFNDTKNHIGLKSDVFKYFSTFNESPFDITILDPPAFAKHQKATNNAIKGYKRLNAAGMKATKNGGILFTFSCSQAISIAQFKTAIFAAGLEVNKHIKILHQLHQPADHPINIYHPEGEYLKGFVVEVWDR